MALRPDFLFVTLGRVAAAIIAVVSLRLMTTLLNPHEYGLWTLLIAFQSFCGLFLINPIGRHLNRYTHSWWDDGTLLKRLEKYDLYIWLVSVFIFIVVAFWWNRTQNSNIVLDLLAGLTIGAIVYIGTWNVTIVSLLNMLGFRKESVLWMMSTAILSVGISAIFVMKFPSPLAWLLGQVLGALVGTYGAWRVLRRHSGKGILFDGKITFKDFLNYHSFLKFCLPLGAATGFMWLQNTGYRFFVGNGWGVADLAILAVGLGVAAQLAAILESLAMQFLSPYFYRRISGAQSDIDATLAFSDLLNVLTPIYAIWAGFNAICAVSLLQLLTDVRYHAAAPFVVFGAVIEFARCLTNLWSNAAHVKRQTTNVIPPYILGAAIVWSGIGLASHFKLALGDLPVVLVFAGFVTCFAMIFFMRNLLSVSLDLPRLVISMGLMGTCFILANTTMIHTVGFFQEMAVVIIGGMVSALLMAGMLWKNPALLRLLSASLKSP